MSKDLMKRLEFYDFEDFADEIDESFTELKDPYKSVSIVAKYEEAKCVISELIRLGYDLFSVELHDYEFDGYDAEYIITLDEHGIWCEPMLREKGYLYDESNITYIMDNCNSKVIEYCGSDVIYEIYIKGSDEEDNNSDDEDSDFNDNEKSNAPVEKTRIKYYVNDNKVDKETYEKYIKDISKFKLFKPELPGFGDLSDFADFCDEMNKFRKLFGW